MSPFWLVRRSWGSPSRTYSMVWDWVRVVIRSPFSRPAGDPAGGTGRVLVGGGTAERVDDPRVERLARGLGGGLGATLDGFGQSYGDPRRPFVVGVGLCLGLGGFVGLWRGDVPDGFTAVHADGDHRARELGRELGSGVAEELDHGHAQSRLENGDQATGHVSSGVVGELRGAVEVVCHGREI